MTSASLYEPLLGGVLIGLAASSLLLFRGRIAGVSGIVANVLSPTPGETAWSALFLAGLFAGGFATFLFLPDNFAFTIDRSIQAMALAGLLVGLGTRIGRGCTSGHGVCGISRLSWRSILATMTFILSGIITVLVINRLRGGAL